MPRERELPRREPKSRTEFDKKTAELKTRQIVNSEPPKSGASSSSSSSSASSALDPPMARLTKAGDALKGIHPRSLTPGFAAEVKPWRDKAVTYREDLGGYWNDVRHEIGQRLGGLGLDPGEPARFEKALDWLEAADQDGGLTQWLDRWQQEISYQNPDWADLAASAESLQKAIRFSMDMVDESLGNPISAAGERLRTEIAHVIDAIGASISEQIKVFIGQTHNLGKELEAVAGRLEAEGVAGVGLRMEEAIREKHRLQQVFVGEMPASLREDPRVQVLAGKVGAWHVELLEAAKVASGSLTRDPEGDLDAALSLDTASADLADRLGAVAGWRPDPATWVDFLDLSATLFDNVWTNTRTLAERMLAEHKKLAGQMIEENARKLLVEGPGAGKLEFAIQDIAKAQHEAELGNDLYGLIRIDCKAVWNSVSKNTPLSKVWAKAYEGLAKKLKDTGRTGTLKQAFDKELVLTKGTFAWVLDRWYYREVGNVNKTRELAWQLLAMLRELKARAATTFHDAPQIADYLTFTFDAFTIETFKRVDLELNSNTT